MDRVFTSKSMKWDNGEMPKCGYCNGDYDSRFILHETPISGKLVCENEECRSDLLDDILCQEVEEKK